MHITLHEYSTDPQLRQKDGVNLAHENIGNVLREIDENDLTVEFHDLNRLLQEDKYAKQILGETDCVVSNVGPHAHYYFYLREKLGLEYAIFRDVRTAIWSSYLFQEHLCQPYLRKGDVLLTASHYTRAIYEKFFPHLKAFDILRCYPLTIGFPVSIPERGDRFQKSGSPITLGYVGRLSEDKNFPDIIELLIHLNERDPGRYRLLACGDIHSSSCHPDVIRKKLLARLGSSDAFEYLPPQDNSSVWNLYQLFDAMIFPSTSNLETLGRVLIEASYAGVPVICGAHAAAPELIPQEALCPVKYTKQKSFSTHFDHSLGKTCVESMARAIRNPLLKASNCYLEYQKHPEKLVQALRNAVLGQHQKAEVLELSASKLAFVESLTIDLPKALEKHSADSLIANLIPRFISLQAKGTLERQVQLEKLLQISKHPDRTSRFISRTEGTRCDFTDVGGIDIELCHVAGFYPEFYLN